MDDDNTNANVEEVVEDQAQPTDAQTEQVEQTVEEQVEETVETPAEEAPQEEGKEEAPEERPPSRREQLRVQQLLKRYGPPPTDAPSQSKPDFSKVEADEETRKILEDTAQEFAQNQRQAGMSEAQHYTWRQFLRLDETNVRAKYDVLNPSNKETYHPALEQALQQKYLRFVGYNPGDPSKGIGPSVQDPDITYAEFVEAEMEFSDEIASQRTSRTTQNIAKQVANTGLRPSGNTAPASLDLSKRPEEMSDKELKAAINASMPRDARGRFTSN